MADQMLFQASELALTILLTMLFVRASRRMQIPLFVGSVSWHGGKKKR